MEEIPDNQFKEKSEYTKPQQHLMKQIALFILKYLQKMFNCIMRHIPKTMAINFTSLGKINWSLNFV